MAFSLSLLHELAQTEVVVDEGGLRGLGLDAVNLDSGKDSGEGDCGMTGEFHIVLIFDFAFFLELDSEFDEVVDTVALDRHRDDSGP